MDSRTVGTLAGCGETVKIKTVDMHRARLDTPLTESATDFPQPGDRSDTIHLRLERWESPMCPLLIVTDGEEVLRALEFGDHESRMDRLLRSHYGGYVLEEGESPGSLKQALEAYFGGEIEALKGVKTVTGGTAFQREVWSALRTIPAGTTISYGELAARIGRAKASRAVGAANGANPIPIVVPCHRVIGADGSLTGFGGGLGHKRWLLEHEARYKKPA
jgi:methylated-DNA-[protein]-cysteine S-methyltransferase